MERKGDETKETGSMVVHFRGLWTTSIGRRVHQRGDGRVGRGRRGGRGGRRGRGRGAYIVMRAWMPSADASPSIATSAGRRLRLPPLPPLPESLPLPLPLSLPLSLPPPLPVEGEFVGVVGVGEAVGVGGTGGSRQRTFGAAGVAWSTRPAYDDWPGGHPTHTEPPVVALVVP